MTRGRVIALLLGLAALAAVTMYAGAGSIARTLASLGLAGLTLIVALHLPIVAVMAWAWRAVAGCSRGGGIEQRSPLASYPRFLWARLVRDAAAETLPFSQLGGFVLGLQALHPRGTEALRGALSMGVDLVVEFAAKLPYMLLGVLVLLAFAPDSHVLRPLLFGLALTAGAVAAPLVVRKRLWRGLDSAVRWVLEKGPLRALLGDALPHGELEATLDALLRSRARVAAAFALHLGCWIGGAAELWVVFDLLGKPVSPLQALAIDSIVAGLRTFAFMIPAAAGAQEASYVLAGAVFGMAPTAGVAASFVRRARDLVLGGSILALAGGARAAGGGRGRRIVASPPRTPASRQRTPDRPRARSECGTAR